MKVLGTFVDGRIGGPQVRSLAVAERLREYGVETEFLVPDDDGEFAARAREHGFLVHTAGYSRIAPLRQVGGNLKFAATALRSLPRTRALIDRRNVDVVHANVSVNVHTSLAASRSEAALLWHFNDAQMPSPVARFTAGAARLLADEIVVASGSVADHYFPGRQQAVETLYAPVDVEKFDPDAVRPADLALDPDSVVVGTVGNVNPIKGHEFLLQALPRIAEAVDRPLEVLVVGSILDSRLDYYERLEALTAETGDDVAVRFLGHRSDIAQILQSLDVFVLASRAEACPMAVLEAMAMERPVVATAVGGVPEQIDDGEHGWLVPPERPDALAEAIVEAITHPGEAERRGENARQRVESTFSLQRCVERHLELYRSL